MSSIATFLLILAFKQHTRKQILFVVTTRGCYSGVLIFCIMYLKIGNNRKTILENQRFIKVSYLMIDWA